MMEETKKGLTAEALIVTDHPVIQSKPTFVSKCLLSVEFKSTAVCRVSF